MSGWVAMMPEKDHRHGHSKRVVLGMKGTRDGLRAPGRRAGAFLPPRRSA
jgi:hypothetical protein